MVRSSRTYIPVIVLILVSSILVIGSPLGALSMDNTRANTLRGPIADMVLAWEQPLKAGSSPDTGAPAATPSVRVRIRPLRAEYHPGEPIDLELSISNELEEGVYFSFMYPQYLSITFECEKRKRMSMGPLRFVLVAEATR